MEQKNIIGSWTLQSFKIISPEGESRDWRTNTNGLLIYTSDNYMSVSINGDSSSKKDPSDGFLFYSGKYEILNNDIIVHHVLNASNLERIGKEMKRSASLKKPLLTLTGIGSFGTAKLVWKRNET